MYTRSFLLGLLSIIFLGCQSEVIEITEPSNDEALKANSEISSLIKRVTIKDGSIDNIIDYANCITIKLPVTVIANGVELIINTEDDYELIEAIFDKSDNDTDALKIIFPIEIILSNYTKIKVKNDDELKMFTKECAGENKIDDDIECLDFIYPITLSIYETSNQIAKTISIENDEQFYKFIDIMNSSNVVQINFPIKVLLYDGTEKTINNMTALKNIIEESNNICDEDDDFDFEDDDCFDCTEEKITTLLLSCSWIVDKIKINGIDHTELYNKYNFVFAENGTVKASNLVNTYNGTWVILKSNDKIVVKIFIQNFPDFSFNWILYEIEDNNEIDLRFEDNRLEFEKTCIKEKINLEKILNEETWFISYYKDKGEIKTNNFTDFKLDFKQDYTVTATNGSTVVNGTWSVEYDSGKLELELDFNGKIPLNQIEKNWLVIDVLNNKIELKDTESNNEDSKLIFEKI
ncbi:MAG: hypothetical protein Q8S44_03955 [Flavobacteriaceae bacterium]|nr:hypothetical protein [Flavobacteriaceae bacterium]